MSPALVETQQRLGDWEVDAIIGKGRRQVIVTLVKCKSRVRILEKIERTTAVKTEEVIVRVLLSYRLNILTNTSADRLPTEAETYFTHHYSPWEQDAEDYTNGLARQHPPKSHIFQNLPGTP